MNNPKQQYSYLDDMMKSKLEDLLNTYLARHRTALDTNVSAQFEFTGSAELGNLSFQFMSLIVKEVEYFCKEKGYSISKVRFMSIYDGDLFEKPEDVERISANSNDYISIIENEDKTFDAILFMGAWIEAFITKRN